MFKNIQIRSFTQTRASPDMPPTTEFIAEVGEDWTTEDAVYACEKANVMLTSAEWDYVKALILNNVDKALLLTDEHKFIRDLVDKFS